MNAYSRLIPLLIVLFLSACAGEEDQTVADGDGVILHWMAPSQYDDGGPLPDGAVSEYRIYVDQEMVQRVDPELTEYFLELGSGEWEVTISAVVEGVESRLSDSLAVEIE